jgi:mRNA-degrading endonuclease RelE of RelBE toxin-antitoxin system
MAIFKKHNLKPGNPTRPYPQQSLSQQVGLQWGLKWHRFKWVVWFKRKSLIVTIAGFLIFLIAPLCWWFSQPSQAANPNLLPYSLATLGYDWAGFPGGQGLLWGVVLGVSSIIGWITYRVCKLRRRVQHLQHQVQSRNLEITKSHQQHQLIISQHQQELVDKQQTIEHLQLQVKKFQSHSLEITKLQQQHKSVTSQYQQELFSKKQIIEQLQLKLDQRSKELQKNQDSSQEFQHQLQESQSQLQKYQSQLQESQSRCANLKVQIQKFSIQRQEYENSRAYTNLLETRNTSLETQNQELSDRFSTLDQTLSQAQQENLALNAEKNDLVHKLSQVSHKLKTCQHEQTQNCSSSQEDFCGPHILQIDCLKDLQKLKFKQFGQIMRRILELQHQPRPHDRRPLKRYQLADILSVDAGEYRICYKIQNAPPEVHVILVDKRNDDLVYNRLRRRFN